MEKGYITSIVTVPDEDYSDLSEVLQFFGFSLIDEAWQLQPGQLDSLLVKTVEKSLPLSAEAVSIVTSRTIGASGDQGKKKKRRGIGKNKKIGEKKVGAPPAQRQQMEIF